MSRNYFILVKHTYVQGIKIELPLGGRINLTKEYYIVLIKPESNTLFIRPSIIWVHDISEASLFRTRDELISTLNLVLSQNKPENRFRLYSIKEVWCDEETSKDKIWCSRVNSLD